MALRNDVVARFRSLLFRYSEEDFRQSLVEYELLNFIKLSLKKERALMKKFMANRNIYPLLILLLTNYPVVVFAGSIHTQEKSGHPLFVSLQYLGITYHPHGGETPEIYPLKMDRKAYIVFDVGLAFKADYYISSRFFVRFLSALYEDCAFVTAGCFHLGLRGHIVSWGKNKIIGGVGPTLLFREDWHQFKEYQGDQFYGNRVFRGLQYRFIIYGGEFEYLRKINDKLEFQYTLIPGSPIILTSLFGIRIKF